MGIPVGRWLDEMLNWLKKHLDEKYGLRPLIAAALLVPLVSHPATAQESAKQAATDNAQAEFSVCLAFYSILVDCAGNEVESRAADEALMWRVGNMLVTVSEAAHLQHSDVQLRLDLDVLDQRTFMGNSCSAVGILRARYADQCGELLKTDPD